MQDVLAEERGLAGQPLHQLAVLNLLRWCKTRAGTHKLQVQPFEQALRFGVQAESGALLVQSVDASEECAVRIDIVIVRRQRPRQFALHRL